jgi:hypothetical protein
MLKHYSKEINSKTFKPSRPKKDTLLAILNYSKSVKVEEILNKKVVIILN